MSTAYEDKMWTLALDLMPRGTQTMSKCPDQFVDGVHPKFASRGRGSKIYDLHGNPYIDYMAGLGPIILGYCHPEIDSAISDQLDRGIVFSLPTLLEGEVAERIVEAVPCAEQVRFAKNGNDVCLAAVRIARSYTGREHIAKCGYHGWSDWTAITMRPNGVPAAMAEIVHEFDYNSLPSLEAILQQYSCAAVIMEVQALTPPAPGFLQGVRDLATKYGAVLIFDEVVTGFRWAFGGAQEKFGVTPDLATFGKAMANGMPLSAIAGKRELMQELNHAFFSMTAGGECLSLAASKATLDILSRSDYEGHIWRLGNKLGAGFDEYIKHFGLDATFAGSAPRHNLSFGSTNKDPGGLKDLFYQEMVKRGIFFGNVVYTTFAHTDHDIDRTLDAAFEAFQVVRDNQHNVDAVLEGKRSVAIFRKNT